MKRSTKLRTRVQGPSQPGPAGPGRSALSPHNSPRQREPGEDVGSLPAGQAAFIHLREVARLLPAHWAWAQCPASPGHAVSGAAHRREVLPAQLLETPRPRRVVADQSWLSGISGWGFDERQREAGAAAPGPAWWASSDQPRPAAPGGVDRGLTEVGSPALSTCWF